MAHVQATEAAHYLSLAQPFLQAFASVPHFVSATVLQITFNKPVTNLTKGLLK